MASNPVIKSISDELDSLLDAIQSFELTSSGSSSRANSRLGAKSEDEADFTPVILRSKQRLSNQDTDYQDLIAEDDYDRIPDQAKVAKDLNQLLQAKLQGKPPPPPRAPTPKEPNVEAKVPKEDANEEFDDPLPPPPVDFLIDALAAKLSPQRTPIITPKAVTPRAMPSARSWLVS